MGLLRLLLEYPLSIIAFIVDFLYFKTKFDAWWYDKGYIWKNSYK
jgi:hypothetical protein